MRRLTLATVAPLLVFASILVAPAAAEAARPNHNPSSPRVQLAFRPSGLNAPGKRTSFSNMAACDEGFDTVASPNSGSLGNQLFATAVVNANDVWAVGISNASSTTPDRTLAEHWNGSAWSIVYTPNPSGFSGDLNGVSAISSTDVWAVGAYQTDSAGDVSPFAEHWDGTSWSLVTSLPNPNPTFGGLFAVTAVASNNVWAVGTWWSAGYFTLIEHWDGSSWTVVSSPNQTFNLNFESNELFSVSAYSPTDIWAVGLWVLGGATSFDQSLAEHWDGMSWTIVSTPNLGGQTANNAIAWVEALEPNHAVGVGFGNAVTNVTPREGEAWDLVTSGSSTNSVETGAGTGDSVLEGIDRSGAAVWAVGYQTATTSSAPQTLAISATWNASGHTLTWGSVGTSVSPSTNDALLAVAAISPYSFVAAGIQANSVDQTLIEAYCAFHFTVSGPATTTSGTTFSITVTVQNGAGTTQTGYRGTVHFTSNDPSATLPSDYMYTPLDNGTHTFSVALRTPCAGTITASDLAMPLTMPGSVTVHVTPGDCQSPSGTAGTRGAGQTGVVTGTSRVAAKPSTSGVTGQRIFQANAAAANVEMPSASLYAGGTAAAAAPPAQQTVSAPSAPLIAPNSAANVVQGGASNAGRPAAAPTASIEAPARGSSRQGTLFVIALLVIAVNLLLIRFVQRRRMHVRRRP